MTWNHIDVIAEVPEKARIYYVNLKYNHSISRGMAQKQTK